MGKKGDATRAAILNAAIEMYTTTDYESVSVRALAKLAGVTPPNIYKYFKDKDELIQNLFDEIISGFYQGLAACITNISDTHVRIYRMTEYYLNSFQNNRKATYLIYGRNTLGDWRKSRVGYDRAKSLGEVFIRVLREGQIRGDVRKDINLHLISQFYHGGLRQLAIVWLYHDCSFDLLQSIEPIADAIYAMVAPVDPPYVCPFTQNRIPRKDGQKVRIKGRQLK